MNKLELTILEKKLEKKFKNYVYKYNMDDSNISCKYYHSLRVKNFSKEIALYEKLSKDDVKLAIIIGILHDYGRFEQWMNYNTYSDVNSIDHGELAVQLLFDKGDITNFYNKEADYNIIKTAIKYHNKIDIPLSLSNDETMFCKIIRDADKLDIFNLFIENKILFEEDNERISENIIDDFYNKKKIDYRDLKSKADKIILDLAMFYDINSKFSYKYIIENKIVERLFEQIEDKEKYKEFFEHVNRYVYEQK